MTLDKADQNFADAGWFVDDEGEKQPVLATLPTASHACKELNHCSCEGLYVENAFTCKKYNLPCTDLCRYQGQCENQTYLSLCMMTSVIL